MSINTQTDRLDPGTDRDLNISSMEKCVESGLESGSLNHEDSGLERLGTQIGGHSSRLEKYKKTKLGIYDLKNGLILKTLFPPPRGPRELKFYEAVFHPDCKDSDLVEFRTFIPKFYGTEEKVNTTMMKLSNLTASFKKPCVMDLKMGRVTYDQEASAEKIYYEEKKFPPLKKIGFQITGMIIQNDNEQEMIDKHYTRSLSEKTLVTEGLGVFFSILSDSMKKQVLHGLITRLKKLEDWFLKQKKFSFTASSLLFIYEGMNGNPIVNSPLKRISDVCEKEQRTKMSESSSKGSPPMGGTRKRPHDSNKEWDGNDCNNKSESSSDSKVLKGNGEASRHLKSVHEDSFVKGDKLNSSVLNNRTSEPAETGDVIPEFSVHLIDFAHVFPASTVDENFLFGLQNLILSLQKLAE